MPLRSSPGAVTRPATPLRVHHEGATPRRLEMRWVLVIALALRSLLAIAGYMRTPDVTMFHTPDTASYLIPAQELVSHHRFYNNGLPEIVRTPGYPLLLTAGILVGHVEVVTVAIQILINCFTVWMVYLTTRLIFRSVRAGVLAAALYAIDPLSIFFTSMLSSETLFTAVVMIWVYHLVRYLRRPSTADLIASATAMAASVYIRPSGYFLPLVIASALAAWAFLTQARKRRRLAEIATYLMIIAVLTVPWQLRNRIETGYAGFSGIYSENVYFYAAASVLAVEQHVPFYVMQERMGYLDESSYFEHHPEQRTWSFARRLDYMRAEGGRIVLGNLFLYARIHLAGMIRATLDPGATDYLKFFDLYPRQGGLLGPLTDRGLAATMKGLLGAPSGLLEQCNIASVADPVPGVCGHCDNIAMADSGFSDDRDARDHRVLPDYRGRSGGVGAVSAGGNAPHLHAGR